MKKNIFIILINILITLACKDFPFPYEEKAKNFEPSAKILYPQNNISIGYQDTIDFLILANDIETKKADINVTLSSNFDGILYSGASHKYGQILIRGLLKTYARHRITLNVTDKNGNKSTDEIDLNYNLPNKIVITKIRQTSEQIDIIWNKSKLPSDKFKSYQLFRSLEDDSSHMELVETFNNIDDTTYHDSYFYIGNFYYQIHSIDSIDNTVQSPLTSVGKEKEAFYFENFSSIRNMVISEKHNLLFVKTGYSSYEQPYYHELVIIDLSDFTIKNTVKFSDTFWNNFHISDDEDYLYLAVEKKLIVYDIANENIIREYTLDTYPRILIKGSDNEFFYSETTFGIYIYYININDNKKIVIKKDPIPRETFSNPHFTYNDQLKLLYVFEGAYRYLFKLSKGKFEEVFRDLNYAGGTPFLNYDKSELYAMRNVFSANDMSYITSIEDDVESTINDGEFLRTDRYIMSASNHSAKYLFPIKHFSAHIFKKSENKLFIFENENEELYVYDLSFLK